MLTTEQRATLKAAILANQTANTLFVDGDLQGLADYLNQPASPAFTVWRSAVSQDEIMQNGFDWTRVDNLSVGKARIWEWLFNNEARSFNPSKPNVRAGIDQCWVGTAADLAVRAAVYVHCKRQATRFERIFATGTGSVLNPGQAPIDGAVSYTEFIGL